MRETDETDYMEEAKRRLKLWAQGELGLAAALQHKQLILSQPVSLDLKAMKWYGNTPDALHD